jgi:hypothetical protein
MSEVVEMQEEEEERMSGKFDKTAQNRNWLPWLDEVRTFFDQSCFNEDARPTLQSDLIN